MPLKEWQAHMYKYSSSFLLNFKPHSHLPFQTTIPILFLNPYENTWVWTMIWSQEKTITFAMGDGFFPNKLSLLMFRHGLSWLSETGQNGPLASIVEIFGPKPLFAK